MRKALNDNPVVQIAVLAVLGVVVEFLLLTRMHHSSGSTSGSTTTPGATATPTSPGAATPTTPVSPATSGVAPAQSGAVAPTPGTGAAPVAPGEFVAGPGLPAPLVKAYADGKTVVLLVFKRRGFDDAAIRESVERLHSVPGLALFATRARHIARYSRIARGVDLDRVPALIVLRPRRLTHGPPTASVSYGFRGPDSIVQAIRDALYKGPDNLPYYPK